MRQFMIPALVAIALSSGCMHSIQKTWSIETPETMKTVLVQHVPLGTSIEEAKLFMEREGFSCTVVRNGTFYERRHWAGTCPKREGLDFLCCSRSQSDGSIWRSRDWRNESIIMDRHWSAALVLKNDCVKDIIVSHYVDGS